MMDGEGIAYRDGERSARYDNKTGKFTILDEVLNYDWGWDSKDPDYRDRRSRKTRQADPKWDRVREAYGDPVVYNDYDLAYSL